MRGRGLCGELLTAMALLLTAAGCATARTATPPPNPSVAPTRISYPAFAPTATPAPLVSAPGWAEGATLYLVFVRSFYDSDGDGTGDLAGLIEKLDYLNDGDPATHDDLGVTAIWLLPIFSAASYHGYDTLDHFTIQPEYGTREDLIRLVEECHRRGIRVVLDFVMAHVSNQHPFFAEAYGNPGSPYSDWFTWYDEAHTKYKAFGNIAIVPSLNGDSPAVVEYMLEVARYWMDLDSDGDYTDGIDGFRCDHAIGVPHAAWKRLRTEVKRLRPDFWLLGEVWDKAPVIARYYDDEFDSTFDFPLHDVLSGQSESVGHGVLGGSEPPGLIEAALLQRGRLYPWGAQSVVFLNNHDTNRIMSVVQGDEARARLAATVLFSLPGIPLVYYGEEIGMAGVKGDGRPYWDEYRREPMDWYADESGPGMCTWFRPADCNNRPNDGISVEEQRADPSSLLAHYRRLIALRSAYPALRSPGHERVAVSSAHKQVYAFLRQDAQEHILVVLNCSREATQATLDLASSSLPSGPWRATDLLTGAEYPAVSEGEYALELAGETGVILLLQRP